MKILSDSLRGFRQKLHRTFGPKDPDEKFIPPSATSVTRTSFVVLLVGAIFMPLVSVVSKFIKPGITYVQTEVIPSVPNADVPGYAHALIQLAQREGTLHLWCPNKEAVKPLVETYQKLFSVSVDVQELSEQEIIEHFQNAHADGSPVQTNSQTEEKIFHPDVVFLASEALMQNLEGLSACHSFTVSSTDQYVRSDFFDKAGQWYAYASDPLVLLANKERLDEKSIQRPREWIDLLQDGLKGRYIIPDPLVTWTGKKFVSLFIGQHGLNKGLEIIQDILSNSDTLAENTSKAIQDTGFGKYRACVCSLSDAYRAITKDDFDNLSIVLPAVSYYSTIRSFVCQGSEHTYTAYLWQEFITKREAAEHMGEMDSFFSPVIDDTPLPWYADRLHITSASQAMRIAPEPRDANGNVIALKDIERFINS